MVPDVARDLWRRHLEPVSRRGPRQDPRRGRLHARGDEHPARRARHGHDLGRRRRRFFQGVVDEARVWNVARSAAQIAATKNSELTSGSGLLGRWGLNDGSGSTAANSVSGGVNGTLVGTPTWVPGFVPSGGGNSAPVAVADTYSTPKNTTLVVAAPGVLANDTDADSGDSLTAAVVTTVSHGIAHPQRHWRFNYVPTAGYIGPDSFTYKANDGTVDSNTVTVSLTVSADQQRPGRGGRQLLARPRTRPSPSPPRASWPTTPTPTATA